MVSWRVAEDFGPAGPTRAADTHPSRSFREGWVGRLMAQCHRPPAPACPRGLSRNANKGLCSSQWEYNHQSRSRRIPEDS